jgi:predicted RNA-binding protein with RPS1 domain
MAKIRYVGEIAEIYIPAIEMTVKVGDEIEVEDSKINSFVGNGNFELTTKAGVVKDTKPAKIIDTKGV